MKDKNDESSSTGTKIVMIITVVAIALFFLARFLLSIMPTVGGSFGYGFPRGAGKGRAIREVVVDVDPQVVYRIDDHRFFTLEQYKDCTSGGLVYYNDTRKNIRVFAGIEGEDQQPQDEISLNQENDVLSFKGKFIYAAGDDVIAYPTRNLNYKYGDSTYFLIYKNIKQPIQNTVINIFYSKASVIITDESIKTKNSTLNKYYRSYKTPVKLEDFDLENDTELTLNSLSIDNYFHCDNNIKPRSIKYISK